LSVVILSLIASLLRTAEQCKAKKVEIRVALLHVPRFPTNYVMETFIKRMKIKSLSPEQGKELMDLRSTVPQESINLRQAIIEFQASVQDEGNLQVYEVGDGVLLLQKLAIVRFWAGLGQEHTGKISTCLFSSDTDFEAALKSLRPAGDTATTTHIGSANPLRKLSRIFRRENY
jgi:hypothetical protein